MYLKVDINGEEQVFAFENKTSVTIGRAPDSDIQLLTEGISRNHLVVTEANGEFFVEDLNSTNGTFLNEEKIEPNTPTPFNSFFPMKLGYHVYLYLVDEVATEQVKASVEKKQAEEEKRKREELKAQKKEKLQAERIYVPKNQGGPVNLNPAGKVKRKKIAVKKAPPPKRKDHFLPKALGAMAVILAITFGFKEQILKKVKTGAPPSETASVNPVKKNPVPAPASAKEAKVFGREDAERIIYLDKCLGSFEEELCRKLRDIRKRDYYEGFVKLASSMFLVLNHEKLAEFYTERHEYNEEEKEAVLKALKGFLGRRFSRHKIIEDNYRYQSVDINNPLALKTAFVTDLTNMGLDWGTFEGEKIEDLYVILYKNNSSKELAGFEKFQEEDFDYFSKEADLKQNLKFFWRSGLTLPLQRFFDNQKK